MKGHVSKVWVVLVLVAVANLSAQHFSTQQRKEAMRQAEMDYDTDDDYSIDEERMPDATWFENWFGGELSKETSQSDSNEVEDLEDVAILRRMWGKLASDAERRNQNISSVLLGDYFKSLDQPRHRSEVICLATHGSTEKLQNIITQLKYWNGPSSVALLVNQGESQIEELVHFILSNHDTLRNATIHVYMEYHMAANVPGYPHNILRNIALERCSSDLVVATDSDMVPGPPNTHESLLRTIHARDNEIVKLMQAQQYAMVLPCFDLLPKDNDTSVATPDQIPQDKVGLRQLWDSGQLEPIRLKFFPPGHGPSDFEQWKNFSGHDEKKIGMEGGQNIQTYYPIEYQPSFEPYVLVYRPGVPKYWTHFRGYGNDKASWFMEMHRAGYEFATLTQQYFVHLNHPSSRNVVEMEINRQEKYRFVDYLNKRYPLVNGSHAKPLPANKTFYAFDGY